MPEKSNVTMETNQCPVCLEVFETGALLLDEYMRPRFDRLTLTGHSLCPKHKELFDQGYRFLVENTGTAENPVYTGRYAAVREETMKALFPDTKVELLAYTDKEVMDNIERLCAASSGVVDKEDGKAEKLDEVEHAG